ncbi:hypothetical protein ENBRE01_0994 [Enteropsectra breve]|nr:hypothetical protein ENBRE01_0994 [Enteropsectra breve]
MVRIQRMIVSSLKLSGLNVLSASLFLACRAMKSEDSSIATPVQMEVSNPSISTKSLGSALEHKTTGSSKSLDENGTLLNEFRACASFLGQNTHFKDYISHFKGCESKPFHFLMKEFIMDSRLYEETYEALVEDYASDIKEFQDRSYELANFIIEKLCEESLEAMKIFNTQLRVQFLEVETNNLLLSRYTNFNTIDANFLLVRTVRPRGPIGHREEMEDILRSCLLFKQNDIVSKIIKEDLSTKCYPRPSSFYANAIVIRSHSLYNNLSGNQALPLEFTCIDPDNSTIEKKYRIKSILIKRTGEDESHGLTVLNIPVDRDLKKVSQDLADRANAGAIYSMYELVR